MFVCICISKMSNLELQGLCHLVQFAFGHEELRHLSDRCGSCHLPLTKTSKEKPEGILVEKLEMLA